MQTLEILTIIMIIIINLMICVSLHVYTVASIKDELKDLIKLLRDRNENNKR